ncbi:tRNA amidotransferase [Aeromonas phage CC2]|uniref:GatB/YqeY domain-containing protein n=1 Tax=Aeromonas phage CC2 TaxID=1204516 RepID=I6XHC9_9CAUD|nr:tRNA amidotransferase [Aeromonas phage CC2]AFN39491.1 hypothetical protein CC2_394 [Aeromonas phage CC2]
MLLEQIKKDQIKARKSFSRSTEVGQMHIKALTTLLGEASPAGNETVTDEQVQAVVSKFVKNIDDTIKEVGPTELLLKERALYTSYLPQVFGEDEIKEVLNKLVDGSTIGQVMGACKKAAATKGLLFDGNLVKKVLNIK